MASNKSAYCLQDIEDEAVKILPRNALGYYQSGADKMVTLRANRSAFLKYIIKSLYNYEKLNFNIYSQSHFRYQLVPRMMIDVSKRNLSTLALGSKVLVPIGISPTAMQRMAHPDGECASAKAAEKAGTVFILSTISTSRLVFSK